MAVKVKLGRVATLIVCVGESESESGSELVFTLVSNLQRQS